MAVKVDVSSASRYGQTSVVNLDGITSYGLWQSDAEFLRETDYTQIIVTDYEVGRLDLIAWNEYGNTNYWWVIAHFNNLLDAIADMYAGMVLRIPSRAAIDRMLQRVGET